MKKFVLLLLLSFICIYVTAQVPSDFFVDLSKNASNDSLRINISVPLHVNIGYEIIEVEIKQKGAEKGSVFRKSSRFPKHITNNLNVYAYVLPFTFTDDITYEVTIQNAKICNVGPFKISETFSQVNVYTYSYANPGYKLTSSIRPKKN